MSAADGRRAAPPPSPPVGAIWLSHGLGTETPAYGGGQGLVRQSISSIQRGDTANSVSISLPNHLGTHVDVPRHFFDHGRDLLSYPAEEWVFDAPCLVEVELGEDHLIRPEHVADGLVPDSDLLLLRSGHQQTRGTDRFWQEGPGLSAELGVWLRSEHPTVRAVGMDMISVTTRLDRAAGREAHRAFLNPDATGAPILLVEDMDLAKCPDGLGTVIVAPLRLEEGDGAPVTVVAFPRTLTESD